MKESVAAAFAPDWFIKAFRKALMWEELRTDIDPIAEKVWQEVQQQFAHEPKK